jgi:spore coat protein U-like protein
VDAQADARAADNGRRKWRAERKPIMRRLAAAAALWGLASELAHAGVATCGVAATGPAFGVYNPLNASPTLSNGVTTITCTWVSGGATTVSLTWTYGPGSSGQVNNRKLVSGTNQLPYNFYFDAAFTQLAGDGTLGSITGSGSLKVRKNAPTAQLQQTLYGRILPGQDVAPGAYLDTILVTVNY